MKLTVEEAQKAREELHKLSEARLPGPVKVRIHRRIKELSEPLEPYDQTQEDLVNEYGEDGRLGPGIGDPEGYMREWQSVARETITLDDDPEPLGSDAVPAGETEANLALLIDIGLLDV